MRRGTGSPVVAEKDGRPPTARRTGGFLSVAPRRSVLAHLDDREVVVGTECIDVFARRAQEKRVTRIEDDILITEAGHEVLSAALPTDPDDVAALVGR